MYMKTSPRMVNYGIALALFGILFFSLLMTTMEGMSTKRSKEPMKSKTEREGLKNEKSDKIDKTMLTKEEAEKMVKKLMEVNMKQTKS
jgi:hypothetical protein